MTVQEIVFYLLLIDAIGANLVTWFDQRWYTMHFRLFSRVFPPARGWAAYYFLLVLWIGWLLYSTGQLTLITG
ncbi:MAG TPA: hypothetical protein VFL98_01890 [Candidatus Paceibacterota bacterium]|nr:hypothetical protein [Candidatus Paceibacterota bacterium]